MSKKTDIILIFSQLCKSEGVWGKVWRPLSPDTGNQTLDDIFGKVELFVMCDQGLD